LDADSLLARAAGCSYYVRRLLARLPERFDPQRLGEPCDRLWMRAQLSGIEGESEAAVHRRLRQLRQAALLHIITRDLNGLADLDEVVTAVTSLAEECLQAALASSRQSLLPSYGVALNTRGEPQDLVVIGMGKLGGGELNVSSDIDLVFLYPEDAETSGPRKISSIEYFTRLARKLIAALGEYTDDGIVFRVDTRLRPYGDSGPLVMSFDMLETYLHAQGREWERYAWVKARVVTGQQQPQLDAIVAPFVYRRHLDYSAIASLRELHAQIRTEVARRDLHDNVKLGPGGIREVEFVTQVFQLVRGGREPRLRLRSTRAALDQLALLGLLPHEAVSELQSAYALLRNLEHRLQYVDDQQTQQLPVSDEEQAMVASAMNCASYQELLDLLNRHRDRVTRQFEAVFADKAAARPIDTLAALWLGSAQPDEAGRLLGEMGYRRADEVLQRLTLMHQSQSYRRMAANTQARVDQLMPRLIEAAAKTDQPDATLERLIRVIEAIGRRESYFALLLEYPHALERLAALNAASPWAAQYVAGHPMLLDELITAQNLQAPDWPQLKSRLRHDLDRENGNTEAQMDLLRHFKQAQTMRLLAQDLAGALALETLSDHLSDLAGVILEEVLRLAWEGIRARHRTQPQFAVVGYGKLGGKELGYASDLDLIFLYDDDHPDAPENYARLAQRMNTWLTSFTAADMLYETDLRLRPDGAAGLLVSRLQAFAEYQRTKAWTFEHQALTRARFVAGASSIGEVFERLRIEVLCQPRDLAELRDDVLSMREKMLKGHPNASGLFDIKHDRGGIVDVEFCVQYLVLGYAHQHRELTANIGTLALLKLAAKVGLIDEEIASKAHASYREFRRLQHQLRLQGERYARLPKHRVEPLLEPVTALWSAIFQQAANTKRT
jgi:glutamate-ammonia-ligase adenylyltransferase